MLGGELFQGADEFGGAGDAERDGLPVGLLGALAAGLGVPPAALTVGGQRIVLGIAAVLRLGTAAALGRGWRLVTTGVGAAPGGGGCCHTSIIFHFIMQYGAGRK